ncbi:phosphoadenylyl-sulfate reductase [Eisenibacter elegans]|jgi:phosphoadenosine phosphosulfate reductase|uniref:phosphoadenylyl-sulfate reductase n=1 Tax=Eisenibacter elegans TaxID=997 RepID=UPI0004097508|nr:phosphoadenylyl-sulfate reductase [Eisenibacter elegans]
MSSNVSSFVPEVARSEAEIIAGLRQLAKAYAGRIVFSSSLSYEDQLISHWILANQLPIRIFTLDTGRMFAETYEVLQRTNARYKTNIEVYFPESAAVERLVNSKGMFSFYDSVENRKECCFVRKVQPLNRALEGAACWITGIRAEHSANRQEMPQWELDEARNIWKFHPLLYWSEAEVKALVKEYAVPFNPLHEQGFVSIGCQPCTRAIQPGEDFRAGRWWWEDASKKECGLHKA